MADDKKIVDIFAVRSDKLSEKKIERVWQCPCGGQLFWLLVHQGIMCRSCNKIDDTIVWGAREP